MLEYFVIVQLAVMASHAYFAWRLVFAAKLERPWRRRVLTVLVLNTVLLPATLVLCMWGDAYWKLVSVPVAFCAFLDEGFCILLVGALILRDMLAFAARRPLHHLDKVLVTVVGIIVWLSFHNALSMPRIRKLAVHVGKPVQPVRIVHLSDVHIGPTVREDDVRELVKLVNDQGADVVVITGDLLDGTVAQLKDEVAPLRELKGPVYMTTGNHEYYYPTEEWMSELQALGIKVLINANERVKNVAIAGVSDEDAAIALPAHTQDLSAALKDTQASELRVLLSHRQSIARAAAEAGVDVHLSGHWHGGQFFPLTLVVSLLTDYPTGLSRLNKMWMHVSPGTFYWGPPLRMGSSHEVTVLELQE